MAVVKQQNQNTGLMTRDLSILLCTHVCNTMIFSEATDVFSGSCFTPTKGSILLCVLGSTLFYKIDFSSPMSGSSLLHLSAVSMPCQ